MKRHALKQLLMGCACALALGMMLACGAAWYYFPFGPLFEDGPFHGTPTTAIADGQPDQSMQIFNGFTLESFDALTDDTSAIVQLRQSDGSIRWAIYADGFEPGDVRSVRFNSYRYALMRCGRVYGSADWTYGNEAAYWFITGNGDLRDYWYSW